MQSNINYLPRQRIRSALSSLKSLSAVIYKRLPGYISNAQYLSLTVASQMKRLSAPYKQWLKRTSVFTSILILDQTILRLSSIQLDFWYPLVVAVIFCSTTLLWWSVVAEEKMNGLRSIISRLGSK